MKRILLIITMVALTLNLYNIPAFAADDEVQTVTYNQINKKDAQVLEKAKDTIKVTSNGNQDVIAGINFKWVDKQKGDCLLTVQPSVFEEYDSFTVLLKSTNDYVYVNISAPGTYSFPKFMVNGKLYNINSAWLCKFVTKAPQTIFNRVVVFDDYNRNGVYDPGEQLISNVKVAFNNIYNPDPSNFVIATSDTNGKVEFVLPDNINYFYFYYLELLEIPEGYEISPEYNSIFGLDKKSCPGDIEIVNNEVVSFGGKPIVYVPLINSNSTTLQVLTANCEDNSIVYRDVNYELYQLIMGEFVKIDTQVAGEDGICRFYNVDTRFDVYIRATNLTELNLKPYALLGEDGNSAYITLSPPKMDLMVTLSQIGE